MAQAISKTTNSNFGKIRLSIQIRFTFLRKQLSHPSYEFTYNIVNPKKIN